MSALANLAVTQGLDGVHPRRRERVRLRFVRDARVAAPDPRVDLTTDAYTVTVTRSPSSVRFEPDVARRLNAYVAARPGTSVSSASNRMVDEGLRSEEHPQVVFRDGPAGRRARLIGGPDVWQLVRAVLSARAAESEFSAAEVLDLVSDSTGVGAPLVRAAIAYWAEFPAEIEAMIARAEEEEAHARRRWEREHALLAR